jgi:hypothetical protein
LRTIDLIQKGLNAELDKFTVWPEDEESAA